MTKENVLYLKDLFYRIKQFYFDTGKNAIVNMGTDVGETREYIAALKEAIASCFSATAKPEIARDADAMLLRACRLILDALAEKDYRLAGDLAAVATRLCGVYIFPCLARRKFWEKYMLPLREKHEAAFFEEEEQAFLAGKNTKLLLIPRFSARRDAARYYEEDSDSEMKEAHPVIYSLFAVVGMLLLVFIVAYYGITVFLGRKFGIFQNEGLSGAWAILGYVGAVLYGTGLFSFLVAWIHQYMGHIITFACLIGGYVMMVASLFLL